MRPTEMRIIGITGGVGAGKSRVLAFLEQECGAHVVQADQVGHKVMEPGGPACELIVRKFGTGILREDGTIDRSVLGALVFADAGKREALNAIVHPVVKARIRRELEEKRREGCALFVVEAALLIEDHYEELCPELWYIYADEAARRARLKESRGYTDEKIDSVFRSQLSEEAFRAACPVVIDNSGDWEKTCGEIRAALRRGSDG